jgi:hypothetical protein
MLSVLLSVSLASCGSTSFGKIVVTADAPKKTIDSKIKEPCPLPVLLPERELNQKETEQYWGEDRKNLLECGNKQNARNKLDGVK